METEASATMTGKRKTIGVCKWFIQNEKVNKWRLFALVSMSSKIQFSFWPEKVAIWTISWNIDADGTDKEKNIEYLQYASF